MNSSINEILSMPDHARVWVYQADRPLSDQEANQISYELTSFINDWKAHGSDLKAASAVVDNRFLILAVDERQAMASGCSIDSSVRVIRNIGEKFKADLFNRMQIAYIDKENLKSANLYELSSMLKKGEVNPDTIMFDNTIQTVGELKKRWKIKLAESPAWPVISS